MRVVDAVAEWFEVAGYNKYFGYAGGSIWPFLDALTAKLNTLDGIQAKHESHAVHMADMYYRVTGKIAPVLINKGPGLLNAVGAAASAMHDSAPVLIIAGGGTTHFMGKAGMQEIFYHGFEDAMSVFKPVTKGTWMIIRPDSIIEVLNTAVKVATSGRPGPVFVQLPYDIQLAEVEGTIEAPAARGPERGPHAGGPGHRPPHRRHDRPGRAAAAAGGRRRHPRASRRRLARRGRETAHPGRHHTAGERPDLRGPSACRSARSAAPAGPARQKHRAKPT